jgi:hypothetical protein
MKCATLNCGREVVSQYADAKYCEVCRLDYKIGKLKAELDYANYQKEKLVQGELELDMEGASKIVKKK